MRIPTVFCLALIALAQPAISLAQLEVKLPTRGTEAAAIVAGSKQHRLR